MTRTKETLSEKRPYYAATVETSRALNGIAISEKRVATFSPAGREKRRRKQSRCKAKRSARTETEREGLEGKRDARSGQTGVTGRYPLVACGKGRTRYCYCAFLHPSRAVLSALLQAASDSQISPGLWAFPRWRDRFASILDDRIRSRGNICFARKEVHVASFYDEVIFNNIIIEIAFGRARIYSWIYPHFPRSPFRVSHFPRFRRRE